jgi:glycosyltransferase involved in cell wall biosynthesis
MAPLVSVIIVVLRSKEELARLIESILPHRNEELEIVVIDGGSADGTVELLQSFDERIDYWVSEPDAGIYDAMNKGLRAASGEYVLHLNAGDRLRAIPWEELRHYAAAKVDVVCCQVLIDGTTLFVSRKSFLSRIDNTWHHQGTFYRRAAHLGYDTTYRTGGDFDHNQRLLRAGCVVRQSRCVVADHRNDGVTSISSGHSEIYRSVRANYGRVYLVVAIVRFKLLAIRQWMRLR